MKQEFNAPPTSKPYAIAVSQTSLSNPFAVGECSGRTSKIADDMPRAFRHDLDVVPGDVWILDYNIVVFVPAYSDRSCAKHLSMLSTQIVECQGRVIIHS